MLFAKDEDYGQAPYNYSDKFLMFKVLMCSLACSAGLFCVLAGLDSILGLIVLVLGCVWNLMVPFNNRYGITLSIMVAIVYGIICINLGLFANAFLYVAYYVPMQVVACHSLQQTDIIKNKVLSAKQSLLLSLCYLVFFVGLCIFSNAISAASFAIVLLDALSAALLAFSAILRTLRTNEYILIRLLALATSLVMWAILASSAVALPGVVCVLTMYLAYCVFDTAEYIYCSRHRKTILQQELSALTQDIRHKLLQLKKDEYKYHIANK